MENWCGTLIMTNYSPGLQLSPLSGRPSAGFWLGHLPCASTQIPAFHTHRANPSSCSLLHFLLFVQVTSFTTILLSPQRRGLCSLTLMPLAVYPKPSENRSKGRGKNNVYSFNDRDARDVIL